MAGVEKRMNISWLISDRATLDPTVDLDVLKNIGSFWGGWRTWRAFQTDNVICNDMSKAHELLQRGFHQNCNFFISNDSWSALDRPMGMKVYEGQFVHEVEHQDEIIAMHLASSLHDIVLLLGFDFTEPIKNPDKLIEHRAHNYRSLTKQAIKDHPTVQFVAIDHSGEFRLDLQDLENLTKDTLDNVIGMLAN